MPDPTPRTLTHNGLTLTLTQWAERTGLNPETIRSRIDQQKWTVARALATPAAKQFAKRGAPPIAPPRPCPKMTEHAASGRAVARWREGRRERGRYFGPWGSEEAAANYRRFAAEWASSGAPRPGGPDTLVCELTAAWIDHVGRYYVKDGKPTSQQHSARAAVRILNRLYKDLPIVGFLPRHLKACREAMVANKWARRTVNDYVACLVRCFSWGVGEEMVPAAVADALKHVRPLQPGRTSAPDPEPVRSAPDDVVKATLPHLDADPARRAVLEGMIRAHILIGCRPGELCAMTAGAIDATGAVWCYRVLDKNLHRKARRERKAIWIGPRAQEVLRPFLADPGPGGRLFCFPPRWPRSANARRVPVSANRYAGLLRRACERAKVEPWTPHQLRHNRATEVQRRYESDEAAAIAIGDTPEVAASIYVDPKIAAAKRIALETG